MGKIPLIRSGQDVLVRIDRRLKALGLSQNAASLQAGLSRDAIRSFRRGIAAGKQQGTTTLTLEKLAPVLQTTPEWLISGAGPESTEGPVYDGHIDSSEISGFAESAPPQVIRLVGYVGAGAETHFYDPQGQLDEVEAPIGSTENRVAVEIRGSSLGSMFDRWLVFYDDVRRPVTSDLVGKLCVVGVDDGRILVKKLQRSRTKGRFNLISQNEAPIEDVVIDWAARVLNMAPR